MEITNYEERDEQQIIAMRENAQRQLAAIKTIDEGAEYLSKVKALEAYARATKQDAEIVLMVQEQKLRSMRILGKLLEETELNGGGGNGSNQYDKKVQPVTGNDQLHRPRLADLGITKNESSAYQKIASIPSKVFEEELQSIKENADTIKELTVSRFQKVAQEQRRKAVYENLEKHEIVVGEKKYRVIYADPPWSYGNAMPEYVTEPQDYYTLMSTDAICAMPIKDIAEDNAVMFLWTTSPHLPEAFEVIEAWGFKYKTSFVWDKIKHNMGHYNSVRHEFLLVCTRGSCTPDVKKLFDSVVSIERTAHSEKPEYFREVIDTIYPYGNRIELFSRKEVTGWDVFGNQIKKA
jgi:N6-adenosine-specific RNA methylase IME4